MEPALSKIKPELKLVDPEFEPKNSGSYSLSVQLSLSGCRYCITDPVFNRPVALIVYGFDSGDNKDYHSLEERFVQLFRTDELLKPSYKKTSFSLYHSYSTFVPSELYSEDKRRELFAFNFGKVYQDKKIASDDLGLLNLRNLYYLPGEIESSIKTIAANADILHYSSVLIASILKQAKLNGKQLYVNVEKDHFEIIATEGKKLIFYNTFRLDSTEDFLYFVLLSLKQLNMDTEKFPIFLLGEIESESALYEILSRYSASVSFLDNPVQHKFNSLPPQFYFSLINQYRCAL